MVAAQPASRGFRGCCCIQAYVYMTDNPLMAGLFVSCNTVSVIPHAGCQ